jgi:hypothetical protein
LQARGGERAADASTDCHAADLADFSSVRNRPVTLPERSFSELEAAIDRARVQ